ncbi:MAG: hypothetical protein Q9226_008492, partial [Calogaya cf. arnoldii]
MKTFTIITTLALLLSAAPLTLGLPQTPNAISESVLHRWSDHDDCAALKPACKPDCTQAVKNLCAKDLGLNRELQRNYIVETLGECTVTYGFEIGNTKPDFKQCYDTFAIINDKGKFTVPGVPGECNGRIFGGAFGWNEKGKRTNDPIYAITPKSGNGNCMMPPGQESSQPLAMDQLPDGTSVPGYDQPCPNAISRRFNGEGACKAAGILVGSGCTLACWTLGFA